MEEILASIRRIIADEDTGKAVKPPPAPEPAPAPKPAPAAAHGRPPASPQPPPPSAAANSQGDIDAMLADLDAPPKVAPAAVPAEPPAPDVLDLTEAMTTPSPPPEPAASFRTIDAASDVVFTDRAPEPPPEPSVGAVAEASPQFTRSAAPDGSLISSATVSAVDSAFNSLAYTVLGQNARTLEDLVKEMLRPMLKGWLDDNLPNMVERIVRTEIERVSRGRS
jgi:cell pole-organizing protein PopZ